MTTFTYSGPQTSFTVGETDYCLLDGETVHLDETNKYVQRLLAIGRLKPVQAVAQAQVQTEAPPQPETEAEPNTRTGNKRNSH